MPRILRNLAEAVILLAVVGCYFGYVFGLPSSTILTSGLGDWVDPYFINFLLEHWHRSLQRLADPSSPLMFFPTRTTLGYSHGLILYVPFYSTARLFLEPFPAYNIAVLLVLVVGSLSLYVLCRNGFGAGFIDSLVLTVFFFSSQNVVNGVMAIWSQRASVFLLPPILLLALISARMRARRWRLCLGWTCGLFVSLLFTQDFYTGQLALLVFAMLMVGGLLVGIRPRAFAFQHRAYILSITAGVVAGGIVFLWLYLGTYLEHPAFPEGQITDALRLVQVKGTTLDWPAALRGYGSLRLFKLVLMLGVAAWLPFFRIDRSVRIGALWLMLVSAIVLLIPLRFNDYSIWTTFFAPIPGLSVIRDPKRIISLYELAVVLLIAYVFASVPRRSPFRLVGVSLMILLLATEWNPERFSYGRETSTYDRWVRMPIDIDRSCKSFFIKKASDEYMSRSSHMWMLYSGDSMFVAVNHSIPTLNGYSAWTPAGWELANPQEDSYPGRVSNWIAQKGLQNVCEFDIDERTMKPWTR